MIKISGKGVTPLRPVLKLSKDASEAIKDCQLVTEALDRLEAGGFLLEASRLLAFALPRREAVWWACMCAANTAPPELPEADRKAREAAELWVRQPTDKNRIAAKTLADATELSSPEAFTAMAVFHCGDSITPEGQPAVPPKPHTAGRSLAGAIAVAAVRTDPTRQNARLQRFMESGRNIAAGGPGRLPPEQTT